MPSTSAHHVEHYFLTSLHWFIVRKTPIKLRPRRRIVAYPRLFSELVMSPGQSLQLNSCVLTCRIGNQLVICPGHKTITSVCPNSHFTYIKTIMLQHIFGTMLFLVHCYRTVLVFFDSQFPPTVGPTMHCRAKHDFEYKQIKGVIYNVLHFI